MIKAALVIFLLVPPLLFAASEPIFPSPLELLTADSKASVGKLFLKRRTEIEAIEFGTAEGHYSFGLALKGETIPHAPAEIKDRSVIQISFGINRNKAQQNLPEFGMASIILQSFPSRNRSDSALQKWGQKGRSLKNLRS